MIGTMVLVLMGCGSAVFAGSIAGTVGAGVGTIGVALAFGLSVVAMAYTIGGISGCHINPAITLGVFLSGRMGGKDAGMYMVFQTIGAVIGSAILYALVSAGTQKLYKSAFVQPSYWYAPMGAPAQLSLVPPKTRIMSGVPRL